MAPPSPPLPTGHYIIKNDVHGDPVGNHGPVPPVQPVVRVNHPEIWFVRHVGDHHYILHLRRFVTLPQGNHVESNRTGVSGTKWIIKEREHDRYTIIDPGPGHKGWTLHPHPGPGNPEVLLQPVPPIHVKPPQLWHFNHVLGHSEEEEEEEDSEGEEEEN
ncbi:hypothetical protein BC827DRAFT_1234856 [Russula dissimulans]|nr:hypothetical protein BC827DRAFT_1234856 [Russula dissimulans]